MSYQSTGATVVDFSQGQCGPAMYKPTARSSCQMIYGGDVAPDWSGSRHESPGSLPGGGIVPFNQGVTDFSGGSCGAGMIRPGPTAPCQRIVVGMPMGDTLSERLASFDKKIFIGGAIVVSVGLIYFLRRKTTFKLKTRKPGSNKLR